MKIQMTAKCSDMFGATLIDDKGNQIGEYDGYVPKFFPGEHYGDYVELDIDVATGNITNWKVPTRKDLSIFKPQSVRGESVKTDKNTLVESANKYLMEEVEEINANIPMDVVESMETVLDYLKEEEKNYEEGGNEAGHIFEHMQKIKNWLRAIRG